MLVTVHRSISSPHTACLIVFWDKSGLSQRSRGVFNTWRFQGAQSYPFIWNHRRCLLGLRLLGNTLPIWKIDSLGLFNDTLWIYSVLRWIIWVILLIYTGWLWLGHNHTVFSIADHRQSRFVSDYIVLELNPFRPCTGFFTQHVIKHIEEFRGIVFPEAILIILEGLHVNSWVLISVALILILKQSAL